MENYRPISLLPIYGKLFGKIIDNELYEYFTTNNLITNNQSGFRAGDSTSNQLMELVNRHEVRAVFPDISKAFGKFWHEELLFKLIQNGVTGNVIHFLEN